MRALKNLFCGSTLLPSTLLRDSERSRIVTTLRLLKGWAGPPKAEAYGKKEYRFFVRETETTSGVATVG